MRRVRGTWLLAACVTLLGTAPAGASTFSNPTPVTIPGSGGAAGPASPYPSVISVGGIPGAVVTARATLTGISHEDFGVDIDILLAGPGGQKTILMSDACTNLPVVTLTFDDTSSTSLPAVGTCVSGTFKPTDYAGVADTFPAPAPAGPYPVGLSSFNTVAPNGAWLLYVVDDAGPDPDASSIAGGWSLELLPSVSCSGAAATVAAHVGTAGNDAITGTPGPDVMLGLGGRDRIQGAAGNDVICGGLGKDLLIGGTGKDKLLGEAGRDKLFGLGGRDVCKGGAKLDIASSCEKQKSI